MHPHETTFFFLSILVFAVFILFDEVKFEQSFFKAM